MADSQELLKDYKEIIIRNIDIDKTYVVGTRLPNLIFSEENYLVHKKRCVDDKVQFIKGERCAVFNGNEWHRCEIKADRDDHCEVLLIDIGQSAFIKKQHFHPLPNNLKLVPPQAFSIELYGIKPISKQINKLSDLTVSPKVCSQWEHYHIAYMKSVYQNAEKVYFKEVTKVQDVSYGIVLLKNCYNYVNLNDDLCNKGLTFKIQGAEFDTYIKVLNNSKNDEPLLSSKTKEEKPLANKNSDESGSIFKENSQGLLKIGFGDKAFDVKVINKRLSYSPSPENVATVPNVPGSSDSNSDGYSSGLDVSNMSDESVSSSRNRKNVNLKPMSSRVLDLYDKAADEAKRLHNAEVVLSNTESDNEDRMLKKISVKKLYGNALLHQSPKIEEQIQPAERLGDIYIKDGIQKVLESKQKKDLTQLQTFAYPILTKHHNLVMVSNPHSGKTLASVVALLTAVSDGKFYENLKGYGPKLIILTSLSKHLDKIMCMCKTLLSNEGNIVVQKIYSWNTVQEMTVKLAPGCDVLLTTPKCLDQMLADKYIISVDRLCHIVFDDADYIFDNSLIEIQRILTLIKQLEEHRKNSKYNIQKVVLAEKWSGIIEWFVKSVLKDDGFICIPQNNLLEGAIYGQIKPTVQFIKNENKLAALKDLITSWQGTIKTVIICNSVDEVKELHIHLDSVCERLLVAHDNMDHTITESIRKAWYKEVKDLHAVMLCTDGVLTELDITNADNLIHYQMPLSKTIFSCRFVCLLEKYPNIFSDEPVSKCKVHIFVDENNDEQLAELVVYMKRFKLKVCDSIQNAVNRVNLKKEIDKSHLMLCESFKQYGSCSDISKCYFRHIILAGVDEVQDIPKTGFVKIKVTATHDVGHLSVILLEHRVKNEWTKLPGVDQITIMALKMSSYFHDESNRKLHVNPKIGDIVAVEKDDVFFRASIIYTSNKVTKLADAKVTVCVKRLEVGDVMDIKAINLFYLPDTLKEMPPQAVDVYLCNVQPIDVDNCWSDAGFGLLNRFLSAASRAIEYNGDSHYLCGRIALSIGRNLWLDPVTHSKRQEAVDVEVYISNLKFDLIQKRIGLENPNHLKTLRSMCQKAGLKLPTNVIKAPVKKEDATKNVQWAHLDSDEYEYVFVIAVQNPELLFLKVIKFSDRLDELQKDIDTLDKKPLKKDDISIGDICIAYFPQEETWNRAKVLKFPSKNQVEVFYVDHGDYAVVFWDQLVKIPDHLITKLPMQAIECRLAGIRKLNENGTWDESANSLIYDLSEIEEGSWKALSVRVLHVDLKATVTGGRRYAVALLDYQTNPFTVLNKELVIKGEANWLMTEKSWLDNVSDEYKTYVDNLSKNSNEDGAQNYDSESEDLEVANRLKNENNINNITTNRPAKKVKTTPSSLVDQNLNSILDPLYMEDDDDDDDGAEISDMKQLLNLLNIKIPDQVMDQFSTIPELSALPEPQSTQSKSTSISSTLSDLDLNRLDKQKEESSSFVDNDKNSERKLELAPRPKRSSLFVNSNKITPNRGIRPSIPKSILSIKTFKKEEGVEKLSIDSANSVNERNTKSPNPVKNNTMALKVMDVPPFGLEQMDSCRTPVVEWYQDNRCVWLRILITNVKNYDLWLSNRALIFRCDDKSGNDSDYLLTLNLYGPILKYAVKHSAKGFYVSVCLKKALQGADWPRLLISETNYNWIKYNLDHVGCDSSNDEFDVDMYKKKIAIQTCLNELDREDTESSSDAEEPDEIEQDPNDPFNFN